MAEGPKNIEPRRINLSDGSSINVSPDDREVSHLYEDNPGAPRIVHAVGTFDALKEKALGLFRGRSVKIQSGLPPKDDSSDGA